MNTIKLKKDNIGKGYLILVNSDYLVKTQKINLVQCAKNFNNIMLEKTANEYLNFILNKIDSQNKITFVSGYRTLEEQIQIYNDSLKENGEEYTKKYVALPNASEHQTGLAIDLALNQENIDFIAPSFPYNNDICKKFRDNAYLYGFIERYKEAKKDITKIAGEEWHFRYVGYPHSKIIYEKNFCLEEYIIYLKQFIYGVKSLQYENYRIFYVPQDIEKINIEEKNYLISGNNVDGFIITINGEI